MSLVLGLLLLVPGEVQGGGFEELLAELDAGRFRRAEAALAAEADPLRRAWGEVEIAFRGRDFALAHELSTGALENFPDDPRLRLRAAGAAVWLERTALAQREVEALGARVEKMSPSDREAWSPAVLDLSNRVTALEERTERIGAVLDRARRTVLGLAFAIVTGFLWLLRGLR